MNEQKEPIKILIADDHEMLRDGFGSFINSQPGLRLIAEAANGQQLVELAQLHLPDIIFTDITMPVMDGIQATRILTKQLPQTGIIAFTMFNNHKMIIDMLEAGAKGYLIKTAAKSELLDAIETVALNRYFYCSATDLKLAELVAGSRFNPKEPGNKVIFSLKEKQVIRLICQEYFNKEISEVLHVSIRTVEGHRERIMQKMNARNTVGLVVYAIRHSIYIPDGM
jgi:DNA-binding NarL/FixJ family response regulator